ncbi:MAG: M28 family peptidase [Planctomycetota bacterium]|nr:M28 family peptidase [Planctomycetota bacterium]
MSCRTSVRSLVLFLNLLLIVPAYADQEPAARAGEPEIDPAVAEARLMTRIRQLTFEGRRAGEDYFSHDDSKLVFSSERQADNPFFQIYTLDLETGDTRRVSPGHGKTTCAWFTPDDRKVLFASTHDDPNALKKQKQELAERASGRQKRYSWDYDERYEIYLRDLETDSLTRLTETRGYDAEGAMSPDGRLIVFSSNRHAYIETLSAEDSKIFERDKSYMLDIYVMSADGSDVRRLTDVKGYDGGPFFSPDGRRICWRRFSVEGATAEVYTMNIDGRDQQKITHLGAMSWAPYYHPSGEYFIFTTNKHGFDNFELYLVDVQGRSAPVRVTYTPKFDGLPSFSWDGTKLTWTSKRTAKSDSQIFIADWNHQAARRLLNLEHTAKRQDAALIAPQAVMSATTKPEIRAEDARTHVVTLASERMAGRMTGTEGERLATQYVADAFERFGLIGAGDGGTYFQEFDFTAGASLGPRNELQIFGPDQAPGQLTVDQDWRPLGISNTGQFDSAEVVFAGYGIVAPKTEEFKSYDSFVHLDVTGKWVMVLRDMPEDITPERRQQLARYATRSAKARAVRDKGARGLILVPGPNSQFREPLVRIRRDDIHAAVSIPAISMTGKLAQRILNKADKNLKTLQDELDTGQPQMGFAIPKVQIEAIIDIAKVTRQARNVLAVLRAEALIDGPQPPALVIGGHVDHLGKGGSSDSLAREDERNMIHFGADDNASGIAGLLEIAEYFADQVATGKLKLKRDVIFAAWSGEELGLLGSKHFVKQLTAKSGQKDNIQASVAAYLNMDMIGRLDGKLIVQGVGSSSIWPGEIERRNVPVGLSISIQDQALLPTDTTAFYLKGVPVLSLFTGAHSDYHSPRDTADKVNYEGLTQIARFVSLIARSLSTQGDMPDYVLMEQKSGGPRRARGRVYLGTMPDYAGEARGALLSSVTKGSPADQAGLRGGDLIVELAGNTIENVQDYSAAIGALKVGQPAAVVVLRNEKRVKLTITPGSRE